MIYTTDLPALAILEITLHFRTGSIRNQLRLPLIMRNPGEIDFAIAFLFAACGQHASLTNAAIDKAFASLIC